MRRVQELVSHKLCRQSLGDGLQLARPESSSGEDISIHTGCLGIRDSLLTGLSLWHFHMPQLELYAYNTRTCLSFRYNHEFAGRHLSRRQANAPLD